MKAIFILLGILLAVASWASPKSVAMLEPASRIVQGGQQDSRTVQEAAERVLPRLQRESRERFEPGWAVEWAGYAETMRVQGELLGAARITDEFVPVQLMQQVAERLGVRYVIHSVVTEFTSYEVERAIPQRTGRIVIDILVFDAEENRYVWRDSRTQTSTRTNWFGSMSLREVQDQAMLNALREGLEPFMLHDQRMDIRPPGRDLVARIDALVTGADQVLLNIGSDVGVVAGQEFVSLDGEVTLRVTEVFANGALAQVVAGSPAEGMVVRTRR